MRILKRRHICLVIAILAICYFGFASQFYSYNQTSNDSMKSLSFVRSAFKVSKTEIRLSIVRMYQSKTQIFYRIGNETGIVQLICHLKKCLDFFSKPCDMIGYIGIIKNSNLPDQKLLYLYTLKPEKVDVATIKVRDAQVQPMHAYPHTLGVCVQPVYLHADYTLFVNFFEFWLNQGATKFYIYRESYVTEVQEILNFYMQQSNASIELVDWSILPQNKMMLSIFDCIHRARGSVKFVAQTDLDEIVYIRNKATVTEFVNQFALENPNVASIVLRSQRVAFQSTDVTNISSPNSINFSYVESVKLENFIFPYPLYSKIIYRPERAFRVHSHKQMLPEPIPNSNELQHYANFLVPPKKAVILHMRRSDDLFAWKSTITTNELSFFSKQWTSSFQRRVQNFTFQLSTWKNVGVDIVQKVDACRKNAHKLKNTKCLSIAGCEADIGEQNTGFFKHVKNSWVVI